MKKIDSQWFWKTTVPVRVEDVWYIPSHCFSNDTEHRIFLESLVGKQWYKKRSPQIDLIIKKIERILGAPIRHLPLSLIMRFLQAEYDQAMSTPTDTEPSWLYLLDPYVYKHLRYQYVLYGSRIQQAQIVPSFPRTGFCYVIEEDGLLMKASAVFGIQRLQRVRQLAFLYNPAFLEDNPTMMASHFTHNRLTHVCDVAAIITLICNNNYKELWSHRHTLRLAGLLHDTLTPGGGDTTKSIDFAAFDEDIHFRELFKNPGWPRLRDEYNVDEDLLYQTILGKGLLGRVLDLADKVAYGARDLDGFTGWPKELDTDSGRSWGIYKINEILYPKKDSPLKTQTWREMKKVPPEPSLFELWDCAQVIDDALVITDSRRLARFLHARAIMFRYVYYNPVARFPEFVISQYILKKMYNTVVTKEELLEYGDMQVEDAISKYVGINNFTSTVLNQIVVETKTFESEKDAREYARVMSLTDPNTLCLFEKLKPQTKSGVDSFLTLKDGVVMPFREACPEETREIADIMSFDTQAQIYSINLESIPESYLSIVETLLKEPA